MAGSCFLMFSLQSPPDGAASRLRLSRVNLAIIALIFGALGTSVVPLFVRLSEVGPSSTAFFRSLLALPFLWLWMVWERHRIRKKEGKQSLHRPKGRDIRRFAVAGLALSCDLSFWHRAILDTSIANASFLGSLSPIFVALLAWFVFCQRIGSLFIAGLCVAVCGAVLLMGSGFSLEMSGLKGDVMAVAASIFYAVYLLTLGRARTGFSTAVTMFWVSIFCCLGFLAGAILMQETMLPRTLDGWLILGGLALSAQIIGLGLITFAFAHLPSSFASVVLFSQPVLSVLVARIFIYEPTSLLQVAGCGVILIGIYIARRGTRFS